MINNSISKQERLYEFTRRYAYKCENAGPLLKQYGLEYKQGKSEADLKRNVLRIYNQKNEMPADVQFYAIMNSFDSILNVSK